MSVDLGTDVLASASHDGTARVWMIRDLVNAYLSGSTDASTASDSSAAAPAPASAVEPHDPSTLEGGSASRGVASRYVLNHVDKTASNPVLAVHLDADVVQLDPNYFVIATGCEDRSVRVWRLSTKENSPRTPWLKLDRHAGPVMSVTISSTILVSGSRDGTVVLWSLKSTPHVKEGGFVATLVHGVGLPVQGLMLSRGSGLMASLSTGDGVERQGKVIVWESERERAVKQLQRKVRSRASDLALPVSPQPSNKRRQSLACMKNAALQIKQVAGQVVLPADEAPRAFESLEAM